VSEHPPDDAFDLAALQRLLRFGGLALLDGMLEIFREAAPERLAQLRSGVTAGDAAAAQLALHSLKSTTAQLGAMRLSALCARGEALAVAGGAAELPALADEIEGELGRALAWLARARGDLGEAHAHDRGR